MKLQTLIFDSNHNVIQRIDDFLYQPSKTVIIADKTYNGLYIQDVINEDGWLVREIYLQH